mgnify:CR=1 FL=1
MTTTKKLVIAVVALSLALVAFASVTLAWITAQSTVVTNTFTYGQIEITLDEAKVTEYGVMSMPAIVVNEKVISFGKVLKTTEVEKLLQKYEEMR